MRCLCRCLVLCAAFAIGCGGSANTSAPKDGGDKAAGKDSTNKGGSAGRKLPDPGAP